MNNCIKLFDKDLEIERLNSIIKSLERSRDIQQLTIDVLKENIELGVYSSFNTNKPPQSYSHLKVHHT